MSYQCTPEEIAEKRRIAIQLQQDSANRNTKPPEQAPEQTIEQKQLIERNRLQAFERRKAKGFITKADAEALNANKPSIAPPGKVDSALKAGNSSRQHPYFSNPNRNQKPAVTAPPPKPIIRVICNFEIISERRFEAHLDKYNETVINSFKKISSKSFYPPSTWSFNLSDYENLLGELAKIKDYVTPKPVPGFYMKYFREVFPVPDKTCLQSIEPVLEQSLKEFQRDGVCFGISRAGRFMLADDPGLGKTRQALAIADYYKADFPLLIVTPASVRDFWREQIYDLLPSVNILDVVTIDSNNKNVGLAKVVILSFNSMVIHIEKLKQKRFGVVIFDESHRLKEFSSKSSIAAKELGKQAARVILISGTPALSRPRELYQQLSIIDERLNNFRLFAERYCEGKPGNFGYDANGACNLNELKALLNKKFMIRRTKDDVFSELGTKERIIVELPSVKCAEGAKKMKNFSQNFQSALGKKEENALLIQWYTETASLKADLVCFYVEEFVKKSNEKFLIFGHHRSILDRIHDSLTKLGVNFIRIDGNTKTEDRDKNVQRFQLDCEMRCALLSLKACSVGITLTAASTVIFAELHWTPSDIIQAEGRVHRIGQEKQVKCYFLLAPGTADDIMWNMLVRKQGNISKAGLFSSNEQFSSNIDRLKFEPASSTASMTPKKSITTYFVKATSTPRKSDDMDSSDSYMTCRTSSDDIKNEVTEVEMAENSTLNAFSSENDVNVSTKEPELNNNELPRDLLTQELEAGFLEMPSYHTQQVENINESKEVLSTQELEKVFMELPTYPSQPKNREQPLSAFDDDELTAMFLQAEKMAEQEMRNRKAPSDSDDFVDIIFSDED